jgi:pyruvate kinase
LSIKILGDLQGYRIRIGKLKGSKPIRIRKGQIVWLTQKKITGRGNVIPFDYKGPLNIIKKGNDIFIDDGNIALKVESTANGKVKTRAVNAGLIKERKGINMPQVHLDLKGISAKDRTDIDFCVKNGVDYIAQSFVRSRADVDVVRKYLGRRKGKIKIVSKIENREGIKNLDSIIKISDGLMVARGDLGVSVPVYEVPILQKEIIAKCNKAGKFVFTATQMLESMTENRIPTRAEVSDVANAIIDGTDYVMLSAESAVGSYPVECVDIMKRIINYTEDHIR